jgi:hypothetical protein
MRQSYSNRIFSGLRWGLVWTVIVILGIFLIFPVFSLPLVGGISSICILLGIFLNFRVSEQTCLRCGTVSKVMPTGSKCPGCGQSLSVE